MPVILRPAAAAAAAAAGDSDDGASAGCAAQDVQGAREHHARAHRRSSAAYDGGFRSQPTHPEARVQVLTLITLARI
eukprot:1992185-Rhodomonas_salina.3